MAIREYIGARYVPIFGRKDEETIEWDNSAAYEPLTIVTYQGNSYTSRQYVPAGIDIDNEQYWALTGNYNAQIEQYRREVQAFDSRITANQQAIEDAEEDIAANKLELEGTIAANKLELEGEIDGLTNDILAIEEDDWVTEPRIADKINEAVNPYNYFNGYNAVFIGDSYTYGTGASDHLDGDTKRFSSVLATKLNMTEFNYGVGSTGFCDPGSGGQNAPFKTQVLTAANAMTEAERNRTHLVVIAGGVNDFNEGATYSGANMQAGAHDAVTNAINNFRNAIILLVPMLFKGNGATARLLNFENALIQGITFYNGTRRARYIRGAWTWNYGLASHYGSDKLHPNDTGHALIANMIYSHIMGGDAYSNELVTLEYESGFSANVDAGGYYQFFNGQMTNQGMHLTTPALTANTPVKFAQLNGGFAPLQNVAGIVMRGNIQHGIWIITQSGACYIVSDVDVAAGAHYLSPINYIPSGSY